MLQRLTVWCVCVWAGCLLPAWASGTELLERAWGEYQFQSFATAEQLFQQVVNDSDPAVVLQAKTGLAMIAQFDERNIDLDLAEKGYREVLAQGVTGEHAAMIQNFLAQILVQRGDSDGALALLDEVIENHLDSVIGQDALLQRILLTMGPYGSDQSLKVARESKALVDKIEASRERPKLVPLLEGTLGDIHFWAQDYEGAVAPMEAYTTVGEAATTSYGTQAAQLYRLAQIYERHLDNPEKAGHFYRRLVEETPSSSMSYTALEKAIGLGAFTPEEVIELRLTGVTTEIVQDLFDRAASAKGGE